MRWIALVLALATGSAEAQGYRTDITRNGRNVTITERPTYHDDGFRYLRRPVEGPNACDLMGLVGIESLSGADAGVCYPSVVGVR